MNSTSPKATVTVASVIGLVAAILTALLGNATVTSVGTHAAAVLAGLLTAVHAPAVHEKAKARAKAKRHPHPRPRVPVYTKVYDTITTSSLQGVVTTSGEGVAGYVDGSWADAQALADAFPDDYHASITATGRYAANWADVERGDLTVAGAVQYWENFGHRKDTYGFYISLAMIPALRAAMSSKGWELGRDYEIWAADWTGYPYIPPGCAGGQWRSTPGWDESLVYTAKFFGLAA